MEVISVLIIPSFHHTSFLIRDQGASKLMTSGILYSGAQVEESVDRHTSIRVLREEKR